MEAPWLILIFSLLKSFIECSSVEVVVNTDKIKDVVSPQFLSMTIDPITLASAAPLTSKTLEMAKSLSPSYVRICGHGTNFLHFGKQLFKDNTTVTENEIDSIVKFAKEANLDLIVGLNAMERDGGQWHFENSHKLISYMAKKGYEASWQLGYETNSIKMEELTQDLRRLKKILSMYPIYGNSLILGPDFDNNEAQNVENFVKKTGPNISSVVLSVGKEDEKTREYSLKNFKKTVSQSGTKSLILALKDESDGTFEEAMMLAKNLGSAANLGYSMVFRNPGKFALTSPTPEFWFSYLYKMLVGKEVFETKLSPSLQKVKVYSHNTPTESKSTLFLDKGKNYEIGALTMFGVNESPERVELNMKMREDEDVHVYVLNFDRKEKMTFLNGKKLRMQNGFLPVIAPEVVSTSKIEMPPNSIFFIVRPNANVIKSPLSLIKFPMARMMTRITTRAIKPLSVNELLESYKKLTENIQSKILPNMDDQNLSISYITYTDNGWLNKLVEMVSKGEYGTEDRKERKRRSLEETEKSEKDKDETVGAFFGENEDQKEIDQTLLGIVKEGTNPTKESEEESQEEKSDSNEPTVAKEASVDSQVPEESQMIEKQKEAAEEPAPQETPLVDQIPAEGSPINIFPYQGPSFIPIPISDPEALKKKQKRTLKRSKMKKTKIAATSKKIPSRPIINEKKENMINSILAKIVTTEDAKYANKPVDFTKLDYEDNSAPLVEVVDPETKETIFMPLEKLDSGDSISLPDYGPTTTKVQREINTDLLKEKILETRKKFGTLGKSKILHVPQESELTKASENIKGFWKKDASILIIFDLN